MVGVAIPESVQGRSPPAQAAKLIPARIEFVNCWEHQEACEKLAKAVEGLISTHYRYEVHTSDLDKEWTGELHDDARMVCWMVCSERCMEKSLETTRSLAASLELPFFIVDFYGEKVKMVAPAPLGHQDMPLDHFLANIEVFIELNVR